MGQNQQLSLTTDGRTLQVTWLIGDADVISYTGNYIYFKKYLVHLQHKVGFRCSVICMWFI